MNGQRISQFEVIEHIGSGGMGSVYRARDTRLDRDVALKFLSREEIGGRSAKDRLLAEARAASKLDHPNICTVYEVGESDQDELFVAMALCRGRSLDRCLQEGPVPVEQVVGIAAQIAEGLGAAHARGIVHRDVKPANIIIDDDGRVKIVDFGLATLSGAHLSKHAAASGTTAYMAPEQVRGECVDERGDVWAFGVLLYQLLSARLPFHAEYEQAIMYRILHDEPDPLHVDVPPKYAGLKSLIEACLQKDPELRPANMSVIAESLREGAPPQTAIARPSRLRASVKAAVESRPVAKGVTAIGAIIVLSLALLFTTSPAIPGEKYLAVLPLVSMGGEQGDQLLSDGLTVTLTNQLAQLAGFTDDAFWVVPHSEVRGQEVTSASMARRTLGATLVLEGTLVRVASGLRLNFELIDTRTLRTVRAMHVTIEPDQLGLLQDEVAGRIAEMMRLQLADESHRALRAGRTAMPEALDPYFRARAYLDRHDRKDNLETAVVLIEQAIAIDPGFGGAHATLGEAHWRLYGHTRDELHVTLAQRHLETALSIDDRIAAAYVARARVYAGTGRAEQALEAANRAIELEPASAEAYVALGRIQARLGLEVEAEASFQHAIMLRPAYWGGYEELGTFYYTTGRYEEAIEQFTEIASRTPDNARAHSNLGATYFMLDRSDDALMAFERSLSLYPSVEGFSNLATLYFNVSRFEDAAGAYRRALAIEDGEYWIWAYLAATYAALGQEADQAIALDEAIRRAERQLRVNPDHHRVRAELSHLFMDADREHQAVSALRFFEERRVDDIEVMTIIGEAYAKLGHTDHAITWLCNALRAGYPRSQVFDSPSLDRIRDTPDFDTLTECESS